MLPMQPHNALANPMLGELLYSKHAMVISPTPSKRLPTTLARSAARRTIGTMAS